MRTAIVDTKTNTLINVVEYDEMPSNPPPGFDEGVIAVASEDVNLDWTWDGASLIPAVVVIPADPQATQVTPAQAKLALYNAGLLDAVEGAIASSYRPIQIYWQAASVFDLNHPYIRGIGGLLGLTDEQMAELFTAAALL